MSGIQVRATGSYPNDPGDGLRIEPKSQVVEIGITWDGAERLVVRVDAEALLEIAQEALDWTATKIVTREPRTRCLQCQLAENALERDAA